MLYPMSPTSSSSAKGAAKMNPRASAAATTSIGVPSNAAAIWRIASRTGLRP